MGIAGVGVDVVDVARFADLVRRRPAVVERLFSDQEQRDAHGAPERLAVRFAAKEAALKMMGVGFGAAAWRDIEVASDERGAPRLVLHRAAADLACERAITTTHLSLTHSELSAVAFVVGER